MPLFKRKSREEKMKELKAQQAQLLKQRKEQLSLAKQRAELQKTKAEVSKLKRDSFESTGVGKIVKGVSSVVSGLSQEVQKSGNTNQSYGMFAPPKPEPKKSNYIYVKKKVKPESEPKNPFSADPSQQGFGGSGVKW